MLLAASATAQTTHRLSVDPAQPGPEIQPTMWGVFFEDINFAADGGLYAELVKNRSFEFLWPMMGWNEIKEGGGKGKWLVINRGELAARNPRFLRLTADAPTGAYGIQNEGFRGMGVKKGETYRFSVLARKFGVADVKMRVELVDSLDRPLGNTIVEGFTADWKPFTASFTCEITEAKARLNVWLEGEGALDLDMISLFPEHTWKNRPNGLRADLVGMLEALHPGFIRFPGGCIVEGRELANRYQWKKTVGPVDERELIINRWNTEFAHRSTPDYFQSFGLGFYEYFQLAEDLGAEPLPILSCGMACQFNTGEVVPIDQLDPYIQDALDLIEFANGPADQGWGKLRADMGHPAPFRLKMLGVGNEQWGEQYVERYKVFAGILREKHPEIRLVTGSGPFNRGEWFDYLWGEMRKEKADLVDEHYYAPPEWFLRNAARYDDYDRNGPKVFAGEYAAHGPQGDDPSSRNTWLSALTEAAFMTGLERNADVVQMASYAPLFAHVEAWQWRPDLIWFDNLNVVGTPNYYVQKLFSTNKGDRVAPMLENGAAVSGQDSLYAGAVMDRAKGELIFKVVNTSSQAMPVEISLKSGRFTGKSAVLQTLASDDLTLYNSIENPLAIYPEKSELRVDGNRIPMQAPPRSLSVIRVKTGK